MKVLKFTGLLMLCFAWAGTAGAVEVPTLYTAEVFLDEKADNPRDDAYRAALVTVLARVTDNALAGNDEAIDELFPAPAAWVTQFRPGEDDTLVVSFDGESLEQVLRNNGYTVWGSDRPLTLIWMAVDWGQGEREIVAAGEPERSAAQSRSIDRNRLLRERMLEIAELRGLPIAFPLLDTTDLQEVTFSDIWGGFDERILAASERYEVNSVLIGRIRATTTDSNRWTYYFGGQEQVWSGPAEAVVSRIADTLSAEFAVGGNEPLERLALNIAGVETLDAYGDLQKKLDNVAVIEGFRVVEVAGDTVTYDVDVRGGASRLRRALGFAGLIEQQDPGLTPAGDLNFFYNP